MNALIVIGFAVMVLVSLTFTVLFIQILIGEAMWSGKPGALSFVTGAWTFCLWWLTWWLSPFSIVLDAVK